MKKLLIALGIVLGIVVVGALGAVSSYNGLVRIKAEVDNSYAKIETQLNRRYDLIPNLVEVTKGYMEHEKEVFSQIAEARAKIGSGKSSQDTLQANSQLDSAISRLLVLTEKYPELKSDSQAQALMAELAGTENRILVARNDYNEVVTKYNTKIKSIPTVIFANMFGYKNAPLYQADEAAKTAPKVKLK